MEFVALVSSLIGTIASLASLYVTWISIHPIRRGQAASTSWLRITMGAVICAICGALPEWPSQTGLFLGLDKDVRDALSLVTNYLILMALPIAAVLSIINGGKIFSILSSEPDTQKRMVAERWTVAALGLLSITSLVMGLEVLLQYRVWAGNQDTQLVWLVGIGAQIIAVVQARREPYGHSLSTNLLLPMGLILVVLVGKNLHYMVFGGLQTGDIVWAFRQVVLQGMLAVLLAGILMIQAGIRRSIIPSG